MDAGGHETLGDLTNNQGVRYHQKILMLADGGDHPWSYASYHLEETSFKETYCETEEERDYLLKVRNPINLFSQDPEEESYSVCRG